MLLQTVLAFAAEESAALSDHDAFQSDEEDDLAVVSNQEQAQAAQVSKLHEAGRSHVGLVISGTQPSIVICQWL